MIVSRDCRRLRGCGRGSFGGLRGGPVPPERTNAMRSRISSSDSVLNRPSGMIDTCETTRSSTSSPRHLMLLRVLAIERVGAEGNRRISLLDDHARDDLATGQGQDVRSVLDRRSVFDGSIMDVKTSIGFNSPSVDLATNLGQVGTDPTARLAIDLVALDARKLPEELTAALGVAGRAAQALERALQVGDRPGPDERPHGNVRRGSPLGSRRPGEPRAGRRPGC